MRKYVHYLAPFLIFIAFILDAQISTLLTNLAPRTVSITSHSLLILGLFLSFYLPLWYSLVLYTLLGFIYDIYYLDIMGMSITLLPLTIYLIYYFYQNLRFKRITNYSILLVIVFNFEFGSFALARLFQLTNLSMFIFVFNNLMPSLLFNLIFLLFCHPLLEKVFGITNKT